MKIGDTVRIVAVGTVVGTKTDEPIDEAVPDGFVRVRIAGTKAWVREADLEVVDA